MSSSRDNLKIIRKNTMLDDIEIQLINKQGMDTDELSGWVERCKTDGGLTCYEDFSPINLVDALKNRIEDLEKEIRNLHICNNILTESCNDIQAQNARYRYENIRAAEFARLQKETEGATTLCALCRS